MQLRNHPLMSYRGIPNWPPAWIQTGGLQDIATPALQGEIGTLTQVLLSRIGPYKTCYLLIDFKDRSYMGTLLFDDATFCRQVHDLLQQHLGESIRQVGNVDVGYML